MTLLFVKNLATAIDERTQKSKKHSHYQAYIRDSHDNLTSEPLPEIFLPSTKIACYKSPPFINFLHKLLHTSFTSTTFLSSYLGCSKWSLLGIFFFFFFQDILVFPCHIFYSVAFSNYSNYFISCLCDDVADLFNQHSIYVLHLGL